MLSIGIVGLPNVGKSTLFNALTGSNILAANYPFATIEPNTGIVPVPDERLGKLAELYHTDKIVPATVTFVDIAGLVAGASEGEGLGNQFLSHVRSTQTIVQVVRAFDDPNVTHVDEAHDPIKDIGVINTELVLADLQTVAKRLPKFEKEVRANPKLKPTLEVYEQVNKLLSDGEPLWNHPEIDTEIIADLQLLTTKSIIYVFNLDEAGLSNTELKAKLANLVGATQMNARQGAGEQRTESYTKYGERAAQPGTQQSAISTGGMSGSAGQQAGAVSEPKALFVCAKLESELKDLDKADAAELLASYGQQESGLLQLIHAAYATLGLQSYLTAGEKEVRAWTIPQGATAPQAAGVIHGDFERGFIAAEVVNYADLVTAGSLQAAKATGKVRTEGKTYVMQPDDVVEFKFNVSKQ